VGLPPRPRWGSLQRSPRPATWNSGGLLLRRGEERGKGKERGRGGWRGEGAPPNENPAYATAGVLDGHEGHTPKSCCPLRCTLITRKSEKSYA